MFNFLKSHFRPFLRYSSVGVFVTAINFGSLAIFVEWFHWNPTLSSGVAYLLSAMINYIMQYTFTFRSERKHHHALSRYWLVTLFTTLVNVSLFWTFSEVFKIYYLTSQFLAIALVFLLNFFLHHHFTFGPYPQSDWTTKD